MIRTIRYKAEEAGAETIAVNPQHTSQTCFQCGHVDAGNRIEQAKFKCTRCGHVDHADVNAALNILRLGQSQRDVCLQTQREVPSEAA